MTSTTEIRPGTVLAVSARNPISYYPQISHTLYTVSRVTPTQAIALGGRGEIRVHLKNLRLVGDSYCYAAIATDEMQARHAAQVAKLARWRAADAATQDLIDKPLHMLKLSTDQFEALAKAWTEIKAMRAA